MMTKYDKLLARLRKNKIEYKTYVNSFGLAIQDENECRHVPVNPDGLEAAEVIEELLLALHNIDVEATNTIPPDGKEAAFSTLEYITKLINPYRVKVNA